MKGVRKKMKGKTRRPHFTSSQKAIVPWRDLNHKSCDRYGSGDKETLSQKCYDRTGLETQISHLQLKTGRGLWATHMALMTTIPHTG